MPLPMPLLHPLGSPKTPRVKHRAAILALLALLIFTCYFLFVAYPSAELSNTLLTRVRDHDRPRGYGDKHLVKPSNKYRKLPQQQLHPVAPHRTPLALSPAEELAALLAFISALPRNALPSSVNPDQPLDPQLVLDFDPRSELARQELDQVVAQVWTRIPAVLFVRTHSSDSREVRYMLSNMALKPAPLVIEVDQREDGRVLSPLLSRLTRVPTLPLLLIGGQPVGADTSDAKGLMAEIRRAHQSGELAQRLVDAGVKVESDKRNTKGARRRAA